KEIFNAISCPLPLAPIGSGPCRMSEQSGKGEEVVGPIQRRIPGLCQGLPRRDLRLREDADRREADNGADGDTRREEERTGRTVQARGRPSCTDPARNPCRTAVTRYCCEVLPHPPQPKG